MKHKLMLLVAMLVVMWQPAEAQTMDTRVLDESEVSQYIEAQQCVFLYSYARNEKQAEDYHLLSYALRRDMGVVATTLVNTMIHDEVESKLHNTSVTLDLTLKGAALELIRSDDFNCPTIQSM